MVGLNVTARQRYYPIELSNSELLAHYTAIQEYNNEFVSTIINDSRKANPDTKLIDQQPEMPPAATRNNIVTFIYELSVLCKVTNGIFFHAVRLYDRYSSKRVVLRSQARLVVSTCLWLAAKTYGGCNHIINNTTVPTGGRFYGPNPRARIPRISELVTYCGGTDIFDESMFIQMESHILDTLQWDVYEPMITNYVLNVDENCLIQYELYKTQLVYNEKRASQSTNDSDATIDDTEESELTTKIELITLKKFLIDILPWQYELLKYDIYEVSIALFALINKFTSHDQCPFLNFPDTINQTTIMNLLIQSVVQTPQCLLLVYKDIPAITSFVYRVRDYHADIQKKLQLASAMDLTRISNIKSRYFDQQQSNNNNRQSTSVISSPVISISQQSNTSFTPIRNFSNQSDNSVFTLHNTTSTSSPITPEFYAFKPYNDNSSIISINKENQIPTRAKFLNNPIFNSPSSSSILSDTTNRQ